MKGFVETFGFILGILSVIAGVVAIIVGCVLKQTIWAYVLYGCLSILSGIFLCSLIRYIAEHDKRIDRVEDVLAELVRERLDKKDNPKN